MKIDNIEHEYIIARWMYSIGKEIMSDESYNRIHKLMEKEGRLRNYTQRSWSSDPCPVELLTKYGLEEHIYKITLTDKTESIPTIDTDTALREYYRSYSYPVLVSLKIDGFNTRAVYYNTRPLSKTTRGRSSDALDLKSYLKHLPPVIDEQGEVLIVGEMALSNEAFLQLQNLQSSKSLVSQRSSVRSALADEKAMHLLTWLPFHVSFKDGREMNIFEQYKKLESWGFTTPYHKVAHSYDELMRIIKELDDVKATYPFKTDGIVVSSQDGQDLKAIRVGAWENPILASIITGYDETQGPSRFGVKLVIEPKFTGHSTQTLVNITNYDRVIQEELFPGTPVAFTLISHSVADIDLPTTKMLQRLAKERPREILGQIRDGTIFSVK